MMGGYVVFGFIGALLAPTIVGLTTDAAALVLLACAVLGANGAVAGLAAVVWLRRSSTGRFENRVVRLTEMQGIGPDAVSWIDRNEPNRIGRSNCESE